MTREYSAKELLVRAKTQAKKQEKRKVKRQDKRLIKSQGKYSIGILKQDVIHEDWNPGAIERWSHQKSSPFRL